MSDQTDNELLDRKLLLADLPAEGTTLKIDHITLRQLIRSGSVVVKSDGTLHWKEYHNQGTYDLDDVRNTLSTSMGYLTIMKNHSLAQMGGYATAGMSPLVWEIHEQTITLAAGACANETIVPSVVANQLSLLWIIIGWDTDPTAASYTIQIHEEDAAAGTGRNMDLVAAQNFEGKKWMYFETAVDAKDIFVDVAGGAGGGTEDLTFISCWGQFT